MDIKFLGTGGAFDVNFGNSAAILYLPQGIILLDCGHTVFPKLFSLGLIFEIDYILITHLHDDHVGSLATLLFYRYYAGGLQPTKIIYPSEAFKESLKSFLTLTMTTPEVFVEFISIENIEGIRAIDTFGKHIPGMATYAYVFQDEIETVVYSGDLGEANFLFDSLERMRIIPNRIFHEISFNSIVSAHTYYKDLSYFMSYCPIFGYHCNPGYNPQDNVIPLVYFKKELIF